MAKQYKVSEEIIPIEGRVIPQDIEMERAVLGAILQEKDAYPRVVSVLNDSCFYDGKNKMVYNAISELATQQAPIDLLSVVSKLKSQGNLDAVGGVAYVSELTTRVLGSSSLEYHAKIIAEKAKSRGLIKFASRVMQDAYDDSEDVGEQMQRAEGMLFDLATNKEATKHKDAMTLSAETLAEIERTYKAVLNGSGGLSGLPSGFNGIDLMTGGWQKSDLIIIAARPAMGKTAFVLSMATNMALRSRIPVAVFNLEMSGIQLMKRLLSNICEIDGQTIKNAQLSNYQWRTLVQAQAGFNEAPLYVNDSPSLSVFELRTQARRLVREQGVQLIIIDYLQLMNASGMKFGSREQEVSIISRNLKMLAKELNIPIIALSQLNRNVESRAGDANSKRPQLSDLRESGSIEQDADIVCFLHRPEYYKMEQLADGTDARGVGEFIIGKHRSGPIGDVKLRFIPEYAKFDNYVEAPKSNTTENVNPF